MTSPKTKDPVFEEESFASEQSVFGARGFAGNNVNFALEDAAQNV